MKNKIASLFLLLTANFMFGQTKDEIKTIKKIVLDSIKTAKKTKFQQPVLEAVYDFQKQAYTNDILKPKHNQPVILRIKDINKFGNNVEITTNDIKIKDDFLDGDEKLVQAIAAENKTPEIIKGAVIDMEIKVPEELVNKSDVKANGNKADIDKWGIDKNKIEKDIRETVLKLKINADSISNNKKDLDLIVSALYDAGKKSENEQIDAVEKVRIKKSADSLKVKESDLKALYLDLKANKEKIQTKLDNLNYSKIRIQSQLDKYEDVSKSFISKTNKLIEAYSSLNACLVDINRINAGYNSFISFIINPTLTSKQYQDANICIILNNERREDYHGYINDFEKKYSEFTVQYNETFNSDLFYQIIKMDPNYARMVKLKFDSVKKEAEGINSLVNAVELRKKLNNVEIINNVLSKEESFTIVSNPIQPLEDYLEFNVKITQNKDLGNSIFKHTSKDFIYREYVRRGVRWDVSVGTVFDFGIKDQEYEVKKIDTTGYKIVRNRTSEYTPTIAVLLHTSFRSSNMFAFGFSLGASMDLTKLNLNSFFPGVSLLIGKKEKIIFTVGPALRKVKQIKSIYDTETTYSEQIPVENITNEQFKTGWFVGMSYNLTNKQKSKIKIVN